jgi:hypothetical protein
MRQVAEFLDDVHQRALKEKCSDVTVAAAMMLFAEGLDETEKTDVKSKKTM